VPAFEEHERRTTIAELQPTTAAIAIVRRHAQCGSTRSSSPSSLLKLESTIITGSLTDRHASDTLLAITTMKAVGAALLLAGLLVLSIERYGRELFRRFHDRQRQGRR